MSTVLEPISSSDETSAEKKVPKVAKTRVRKMAAKAIANKENGEFAVPKAKPVRGGGKKTVVPKVNGFVFDKKAVQIPPAFRKDEEPPGKTIFSVIRRSILLIRVVIHIQQLGRKYPMTIP
jgi:hypothetical protein